jgi:glycosyltransferase involved in cell wall biosynthesis
MNILMLHNAYRMRGGEDESFRSESRMLCDAGHSIETVLLHNDQVEHIGKLKVALHSIWSQPSYELIDSKLSERRYDVLHVQNFFPLLSPSVYYAARKHGVAVVQTLRNYRLLCPNVLLFRDGRVCEDCLGKTFKYPGVINKCYRGSAAASLTVATMTAVHKLLGTWEKNVDLYISLTDFARNKFLQEGFAPPERIVTKGNFVDPDPGVGSGGGDFVLFAGRLTREKGIETLLSAWELLKPDCVLKIVGEGPLSEELRASTQHIPNVEWLGVKPSSEVSDLMGAAKLLVFPSEWYETFGRVAIESFAKGTPVIASRIGAISEVVDDLRTGLLFEPGNVTDLALKLQWALDHPAQLQVMRAAAREAYLQKYSVEENCRRLMECYRLAIQFAQATVPRAIPAISELPSEITAGAPRPRQTQAAFIPGADDHANQLPPQEVSRNGRPKAEVLSR